MRTKKSGPELATPLPIKLDSTSNGEYAPKPLGAPLEHVVRHAHAQAADHARALGLSRRDFLQSSCGAATVLVALNQLPGCGGGGTYNLPASATRDLAAADSVLAGDEFIFDVQTHHVSSDRPWWQSERPNLSKFLTTTPQAKCGAGRWVDCFSEDVFLKEVFLDSETDMAVLSALWGTPEMNAIHAEEAARTRERIAKMEGSPRLLIHGLVYGKATTPAQNEEQMFALRETFKVDAWKLYPVWSPDGLGYRLDDEATGLRLLETGLKVGVPLFAVHKGLRVPGMDRAAVDALDVGPAAKAFPQATLLIYHSGYDSERREGPYDPGAQSGVDALIRSCEENGIGKQGNVYAELGSIWREVMKDPDQAAHVLGKLLKHFGEDRIVWGTDAIWYGSPQDQIQAFRAFEISPQFQEQHGYPALTKQAKAKIFGLNAAQVYRVDAEAIRRAQAWDPVSRARSEYQGERNPSHRTYGPRTRRELLAFLKYNEGLPG
jgi:predicted TIM-barrel fold metal-dependent hydrolase